MEDCASLVEHKQGGGYIDPLDFVQMANGVDDHLMFRIALDTQLLTLLQLFQKLLVNLEEIVGLGIDLGVVDQRESMVIP